MGFKKSRLREPFTLRLRRNPSKLTSHRDVTANSARDLTCQLQRRLDAHNARIPQSWRILERNVSLDASQVKGGGTFGKVIVGSYVCPIPGENGRSQVVDAAVKMIQRRDIKNTPIETFNTSFLNELKIGMLADSDYVVKTYGGYFTRVDGYHTGVIMQERAWCSLDKYLHSSGPATITLQERVRIGVSCLGIAAYLRHQLRIVHNDVKANNVLVFNGGGVIKLADFGMAVNLRRGDIFADPPRPNNLNPARDTRAWTAGKWWRNSAACSAYADESVDIFAFTFLIVEVLFCDDSNIVRFVRQQKCLPPISTVTAALKRIARGDVPPDVVRPLYEFINGIIEERQPVVSAEKFKTLLSELLGYAQ